MFGKGVGLFDDLIFGLRYYVFVGLVSVVGYDCVCVLWFGILL